MKQEKTTTVDSARLRELAARFRAAILRTPPESLTTILKNFPLGSCGEASVLLGVFLREQGFGGAVYVLGRRGHQWHARLEMGDTVIDITADQLDEGIEPVVVTRDLSWHSQFEEESRHPATIEDYDFDERKRKELFAVYQRVISNLP